MDLLVVKPPPKLKISGGFFHGNETKKEKLRSGAIDEKTAFGALVITPIQSFNAHDFKF